MRLQAINTIWCIFGCLVASGQFSLLHAKETGDTETSQFSISADDVFREKLLELPGSPMQALAETVGFKSAWSHTAQWLNHGLDRVGPVDTPAFYGQINILTNTLATDEESPHWPVTNPERSRGLAPYVGNLHFEAAHLQLFDFYSRFPGMGAIQAALRDYWNFQFNENSVVIYDVRLISAGAHGGYHLILDEPAILLKDPIRLWHELRNVRIPWHLASLVDPVNTEGAIRMLAEHIVDFETYRFNRHFPWSESVSLPSSGGPYISSWAWLYSQTEDAELLEWIEGIANLYFTNRGSSGLPPTRGEYSQDPWPPETLGGEPIRTFIAHLVYAASMVPSSLSEKLLNQVEAYIDAFSALNPAEIDRMAYEFNTDTGENLRSRTRKFWESPGRWMQIFLTLSYVYEQTGNLEARKLADRMADAILVPGNSPSIRNQARHCAMAIEGFRRMYLRSGDEGYRIRGQSFFDLAHEHFYREGWFVTEPDGHISAPLYGSGNLALVVLAWEMTQLGIEVPWMDDVVFEY